MECETFLKVKENIDDLLSVKKYDEAISQVKSSPIDIYYKNKLKEHIENHKNRSNTSAPIRKDSISMEQPCNKHGKYYSTRYDCPVCWP